MKIIIQIKKKNIISFFCCFLDLEFKPSNIRIWIHNRDIGKLQQVLWDGHGAKLRCETSNNPRVKRFLEAVPFIMVHILIS